MVEINFGKSASAAYYPGIPNEEAKIVIDQDTILIPIDEFVSEKIVRSGVKSERKSGSLEGKYAGQSASFHQVIINLLDDESNDSQNDFLLIWIKEIRKWVGIHYRRWLETMAGDDHDANGPYKLDNRCIELLCMAYKIPKEKIPNNPYDLVSVSPEELDGLT